LPNAKHHQNHALGRPNYFLELQPSCYLAGPILWEPDADSVAGRDDTAMLLRKSGRLHQRRHFVGQAGGGGGGCTVKSPEETACSFDYAPISGVFEQACIDAGGRFHSQEWDFDCVIRYEGRQYDSDYYFQNLPFCLGVSCTAADIQQYWTASMDDIKQDFAFQGIYCSGEMGNPLLDGALSAAVVIVLVVLAVCWLCCCQQGSSRKTMYRSIDNTTTRD
jgi:hypothetical protein